MNLELLKAYALCFVGTKYFFGGDDPVSGFDCSGLVSEMMRAAGVVPFNYHANAQGLYQLLKPLSSPCQPKLGAVVFFGKSFEEITHIGFCVDEHSMVEAGGGDHNTVSSDVASRQNAFVRVRPARFRKDFLGAVMPPYQVSTPCQ